MLCKKNLPSKVASTTKTGRHDIAEMLLKVALNIKNQIKSIINAISKILFHVFFLPHLTAYDIRKYIHLRRGLYKACGDQF
jgi:hypothetical protein